MSVEESETMAQLFGAQYFQDYNPGIVSCFSPDYFSSNSPQGDTYIGLNWEAYSGSCNIDATKINDEEVNSKSNKREREIDENKLHTCIEVPTKKTHIFRTNAWKGNVETSNVNNHHDSSYSFSENNSTDKSGPSDSTVKYTRTCLYARKRRQKINERLRTLQKLIPNGTKVDISTMLEEAYQYVKFLQLQIKLLSSDELWMYAPIAFNGIDDELSLDKKQDKKKHPKSDNQDKKKQ